WADFHLTFIGCWREAIAEVLPEPYEARLDETIQLLPMSEEVLEPVIIPHELVEEVRQARIQILHRPDRSLVTVVEMLSPANKAGDGCADFCAKRLAILRQRVHLVELDLLLGGRRLPLSKPLPAGAYYAWI